MSNQSTFKELSYAEIHDMSHDDQRAYYQSKSDHENALRLEAMKSLTDDQREVIEKTFETLKHCVSMLHECHDLYMSDVGKLETAFYGLGNEFVLHKEG